MVSHQRRTLRTGGGESRFDLPGQPRHEHHLHKPERQQFHLLPLRGVREGQPVRRRAFGQLYPLPEQAGGAFPRQGVFDAGLPLYDAAPEAREAAAQRQYHAVRHRLRPRSAPYGQCVGPRVHRSDGGMGGPVGQYLRVGLRYQFRQHGRSVPQLSDTQTQHRAFPAQPRHDALLADRRLVRRRFLGDAHLCGRQADVESRSGYRLAHAAFHARLLRTRCALYLSVRKTARRRIAGGRPAVVDIRFSRLAQGRHAQRRLPQALRRAVRLRRAGRGGGFRPAAPRAPDASAADVLQPRNRPARRPTRTSAPW